MHLRLSLLDVRIFFFEEYNAFVIIAIALAVNGFNKKHLPGYEAV